MSMKKLKNRSQNSDQSIRLILNFKSIIIFLILILLILNSSSLLFGNSNFDSTLAKQLQTTLDNMRSNYGCMGVSAAVIMPGQGTWLGVSGMSNPETDDSIRTDHLFWTASITKMFVATVIFQLTEEGKITLEDTLHQWLPSFQYIDSTITIRQLLNHTSGIHDYHSDPNFWPTVDSDPDKYWTPEELLYQFLGSPVFSPGSSCEYSNTNYILLGMIIEKVTGSDLQTELKNRIGDPLNLSHTYFVWSLDIHSRVANPWYDYYENGTLVNIIDLYKTGCWSAVWAQGNIISTAEDIAIWAKSLFEAKLINQESLTQMLTFVPGTSYGLGVRKVSFFGKELWGHMGALGYQTIVAYWPEDSVSIAILANEDISAFVLDVLKGLFNDILQYSTTVEKKDVDLPISFLLNQNYPNPFNPTTTIEFSIPKAGFVTLKIYNVRGEEVAKLVSEMLNSGSYKYDWNATGKESGVYFYKIEVDNSVMTKKCLLIK